MSFYNISKYGVEGMGSAFRALGLRASVSLENVAALGERGWESVTQYNSAGDWLPRPDPCAVHWEK